MVGPLFFPWINSYYYAGTWSPNVWHNPTTNMVKPFAIAAFLLIIKLIEEQRVDKKDYCILSVVLILSVIAKPSFIQGIVPALVIVVIIDIISMKKIRFNKWIPLAATFVPASAIMLFQLWITFYSNNTVSEGIGIEYMRVLKRYISNEWIALIACIAFPLYILLSERKNIKHNYKLILVMSYLVTTWCEMAFLYEKGIREGDANFAWGYILSIFAAWVVCTATYVENIYAQKYTSGKMKIGLGLFSMHMLFGIWYFISIFNPHYV